MMNRGSSVFFAALAAGAWLVLAPRGAFACDQGITECNGVCCAEGVTTCFNGVCDSSTCSNVVCGGVCCSASVTVCFNGACDTSGSGDSCENSCGTGCCTADEPVCCGDGTCAATESACSSNSSCAVKADQPLTERSSSWLVLPAALAALAALRATSKRARRNEVR